MQKTLKVKLSQEEANLLVRALEMMPERDEENIKRLAAYLKAGLYYVWKQEA